MKLEITMTPYTMKYIEWECVSESKTKFEIDSEKPEEIGCNKSIYEVMSLMKSERHPELSYQLCEAQFSKLENYGIETSEVDPIERLITKYEVSDVRDHKTVGYILCIWDCINNADLLQFHSTAKKYLDEYFKEDKGTYTTYTVFDEMHKKLFSSHFRFSPMAVMFSPNPLSAFASILCDEVSGVLSVSNLLPVEPKYRYDLESSEFQFETLDGVILKVKCDQLFAAKVKFDEENGSKEPDSDLD